MKLNELAKTTLVNAKQALTEHYNMPFNLDKMSTADTSSMLRKVRTLVKEAKASPSFYRSQNNPTYLKLVFMEQALTNYMNTRPAPRFVVENEEVEKSQVVLAAQDMVDSVQKMLEQVSDMTVKEMPALIDSVQSEIGVNESEQFSQQATAALTALTAALTQAKTALQGALGVVTGNAAAGDASAFDADAGAELGDEFPAEPGAEDEFDTAFGDEPVDDESEEDVVPSLGRERR